VQNHYAQNGSAEHYAEKIRVDGFAVIQDMFTAAEIGLLRNITVEHVVHGDYQLANECGWTLPNFLSFDAFAPLRPLLLENRLFHDVLKSVMGGMDYRFCSHNDIGINRLSRWHKDRLNGAYRKYQTHDIWSQASDGSEHQIYKLLIYTEDHSSDDHALKVITGTHLIREDKPYRADEATQLRPALGAGIIIDQRITHIGQSDQVEADAERILLSVGWGKENIFTDEFEEGTIARQREKLALLGVPTSAAGGHWT
jgi:hypothetical protein